MKISLSMVAKEITVYRLEHKDTKEGPYTHEGQILEVLQQGIQNNVKVMPDIDDLPEVKKLIRKFKREKRRLLFGFTSEKRAQDFVKDWSVLTKHGFILSKYKAVPLYISQDGQVIFEYKS
jgi:hypothetical protein